MADAMCGPSGGTQKLLNTFNRDRTGQQDRILTNAHTGASGSFRTVLQPRANDEYASQFLSNPGAPALGLDSRVLQSPAPSHFASIARGQTPSGQSLTPISHNNGPGAAHLVSEFQSFSLSSSGRNTPQQVASNSLHAHDTLLHQAQPALTSQIPAYSQPAYYPASMQLPYGAMGGLGQYAFQQSGFQAQAQPQLATAAVDQYSHIDRAAFDAAFSDLEDEMQKEMDAFVSGTESQVAQAPVQAPTQEEWAEINQNLESMAADLKESQLREDPEVLPQVGPEADARKKRAEDRELRKQASLLIQAFADKQDDKYRQSNFLSLMEDIVNRDVVIENDNFVDSVSGEVRLRTDPEKVKAAAARHLNADIVDSYHKLHPETQGTRRENSA